MRRSLSLVAIFLLSLSCSDGPGKGTNVGNEDASNNAATSDAGSDAAQNNGLDAANSQTSDMASTDASNGGDDLGLPPDLGMNPEGILRVPCDDTTEDVYAATPANAANGTILACAESETATMQQVTNRTALLTDVTIESGYTSYLVAYQTTRATGEAAVGTMVLYLPDTDVQGGDPYDLVVANHGSIAVPDDCAPSQVAHNLKLDNSIILPWVGQGVPVAAPDMAGLGTSGVMGVANTLDLGRSALDAALAAHRLLDDGEFSDRVLSIGQGEGAHASYAMQAYAADYAPSVDFAGAIGYATAYPQVSYAELMRLGGIFPLVDGVGARRAIAALVIYSDFYNLFGEARARDGFHPDRRDYVADAIEEQCFVELAVTLATETADYTPPAILAGLVDPDFRMDVVQCLNGNGCSADAQAFVDRAEANVQELDADGGELLFISAFDGTYPGPNDQACLMEWMTDNGKEPEGCLWSGANNINISAMAAGYAVDWGIATLAGDTPPACPQNQFPSCQ